MTAKLNDTVLAESDETIVVEGNHYFPPDSVNTEHFSDSSHATVCPWKGNARYYNIAVGGTTIENGAWYYPEPKDAARQIAGYVAFYPGQVQIS